ncbi:protein starmaker-like [Uranotaenia lowii]|uniref:protein starmaker-like n=1 Tax=Uranotaenia lowii TaxID=190385 RepID=UPI0024789641|nr:protein starmaker-like [Uranotaenia lowii]
MSFKGKTCLFCLKQRQILVKDQETVKTLRKVYNLEVTSEECRICAECHFNIGQINQFKNNIEAASDIEPDNCFVCKSEITLTEPDVERVVDYLRKQCTTIDFSSTDAVKACVTCLYLLEISIKYEKLAKNYANTQRICKQFATLRECNVALWKIDLDTLGSICGLQKHSKNENRGVKRGRTSAGSRDEQPTKRSKLEDGAVLPVMLTKLTPTVNRPGMKKGSSSSPSGSKGKGSKSSDKFFIKLPMPKMNWKKQKRPKTKTSHSPIRVIPQKPTTEELNHIFNTDLRPLSVQIEHVDLSSYMNRTIAHDKAARLSRKPRKEEFIGLDEEDMVDFQNTSISSVGKRKSILITERIESPNSAKKKVKFSDSPSIKYVERVDLSGRDDDEESDEDDDKDDADYEGFKRGNKKGPKDSKTPNGTSPSTPENGRSRRGVKQTPNNNDLEENVTEKISEAESSASVADETAANVKDKNSDERREKSETPPVVEKNQAEDDLLGKDKSCDTEGNPCDSTQNHDVSENTDKPTDTTGNIAETRDKPLESTDTEEVKEEQSTSTVDTSAPMDAEDSNSAGEVETDTAEPMKTSDDNADSPDAEMKDVDQPDDVEMHEAKAASPVDVEMKDLNGETESIKKTTGDCLQSTSEEPVDTDFDTFDKQEEEIQNVKDSLVNILGVEISDSENEVSQDNVQQSNSAPEEVQNDQKENKNEEESSNLKDETQPEENEEKYVTEEESAEKIEHNNEVTQTEQKADETHDADKPAEGTTTPEKKNQSFSSLDDVDDISDDDDILDQLDNNGVRTPDLPPLGEDSL